MATGGVTAYDIVDRVVAIHEPFDKETVEVLPRESVQIYNYAGSGRLTVTGLSEFDRLASSTPELSAPLGELALRLSRNTTRTLEIRDAPAAVFIDDAPALERLIVRVLPNNYTYKKPVRGRTFGECTVDIRGAPALRDVYVYGVNMDRISVVLNGREFSDQDVSVLFSNTFPGWSRYQVGESISTGRAGYERWRGKLTGIILSMIAVEGPDGKLAFRTGGTGLFATNSCGLADGDLDDDDYACHGYWAEEPPKRAVRFKADA